MSSFEHLWPVIAVVASIILVGSSVVWLIYPELREAVQTSLALITRGVLQAVVILVAIISLVAFLGSLDLSYWKWSLLALSALVIWICGYCLWKEHKSLPARY